MQIQNKLFHGSWQTWLPQMSGSNINLCFTSPPYANQRSKYYPSIDEKDYPSYTLQWCNLVGDILASDGSIIINIREHELHGQQSLYVLKTVLYLCENGWKLNGRFIWHKTTAPPLGSKKRLRRAFEDLYWFSRIEKPYIDAKGLGKLGSVGFTNKRYFEMDLCCQHKERIKDKCVRSTDVFQVGVTKNQASNPHPAQFPEELASNIIKIFCPLSGIVMDPFMGSGTTAAAAIKCNRHYCGIEMQKEYISYAEARINCLFTNCSPK